jgi:hypothetical protein
MGLPTSVWPVCLDHTAAITTSTCYTPIWTPSGHDISIQPTSLYHVPMHQTKAAATSTSRMQHPASTANHQHQIFNPTSAEIPGHSSTLSVDCTSTLESPQRTATAMAGCEATGACTCGSAAAAAASFSAAGTPCRSPPPAPSSACCTLTSGSFAYRSILALRCCSSSSAVSDFMNL